MKPLAPLLLLLLAACTPDEDVDAPRWVQVLAKPCALADDGTLACWSRDDWLDDWLVDAPASTDARAIQSIQEGVLRGLGTDGSRLPLACPDYRWDPCTDVGDGLSQVTDWGGVRNGTFAFDRHHAGIEPPDRTWDLFADDRVAALDRTERVWFAAFGELSLSLDGAPLALAVDVVDGQPGACVLDNTGTIACAGEVNHRFDDPPYVLMSGRRGAYCAVKAPDRVVCSDDRTSIIGDADDPVVQLDVAGFGYYDAEGLYVEAGTPSFCALTASGRLTCIGPRYPDGRLER